MSSHRRAPSVALILLGSALASLSACQAPAPRSPDAEAGLAPIRAERAERLVDVDPSALYTPEELAPLLVLTSDPPPATLAPLSLEQLRDLRAAPAHIARMDLRWAHDPGRWPETVPPPGIARLIRAVHLRDCETGPCDRVIAIEAGQTLLSSQEEGPEPRIAPLLDYLLAHPALFALTREAQGSERASITEQPWLEIRCVVRTGAPARELVPRTELDAPRDWAAGDAFTKGAAGEALPSVDPQAPPDPATAPAWVDADAEGIPYMQIVDPGAVLYSFTLSPPTDPETATLLLDLATELDQRFPPPVAPTSD